MLKKTIYNKPALSISQQINLLRSRNLNISDEDKAKHYLQFIGYYRLSGYTRFFYLKNNSNSVFKEGSNFDAILDLYIFDRELRLLIMDAMERIEVAIRTAISNWMSIQYGAHWYTDPSLFLHTFFYEDFITAVKKETEFHKKKKRKNPIFSHYYTKYENPSFPASWMLAEGLSLGTWSKIFEYLGNRKDKASIAKEFNLSYIVLQSWLQSLTFLRNICAHHAVVWNRTFHIMPCIPHSMPDARQQFLPNNKLYTQAAMLYILLEIISKNNHWSVRLKDLIEKHPNISMFDMGFKKAWSQDPFWGLC